MDGLQIVATSIGVIGFVLLIVLFACRILGPKTTAWVCSNREEKIGFSKSKLYNANGYLVSVEQLHYSITLCAHNRFIADKLFR